MAKPRPSFPLVTLPDGRALSIGGGACEGMCPDIPGPEQSATFADLYDPIANTWSPTAGLNIDRSDYSTTVLKDGRVLVAGGNAFFPNECYSSAKLFDPRSGTWSQTTGLMSIARCDPGAARLQDGRVLVMGGWGITSNDLSSAEVFDPTSQTWTAVASMPGPKVGPQAVTLGSGKVLVTGAREGSYFEGMSTKTYLYDPASNKWSVAADLPEVANGRLIGLADGSALLVGEASWGFDPKVEIDTATATWVRSPSERFDPKTATWSRTAEMAISRIGPSVVLLADGRVLVAGGAVKVAYSAPGEGRVTTLTDTAEIYDPGTDSWTSAPPMPSARQNASATLLLDGSVLIAGGDLGESGCQGTPGFCHIDPLATAVRFVP